MHEADAKMTRMRGGKKDSLQIAKVDNLPAGEYDMEVWHERLGPRRQLITVSGESLILLNVVYAPDQVR